MKVSVITVTWNSKDFILKQIHSVRKAVHFLDFEHIIVDNASSDGTVASIEDKFSWVHIIRNIENKGFSAANNQAFAIATGDYILFLNPDCELAPGSLDTFVEWMDAHPKVGIAGPKLVDVHGVINQRAAPRRFPKFFEQIALILKLPHVFPSILDNYLMKGFDFDREQEVDSVQGSCILVRRSLLHTLGFAFDPRYFIWFEDVDLCRECIAHGMKVMYTPVVIAIDYSGQSFKKRKFWWKQKQFFTSMMIYFRKWGFQSKKEKVES